MEKPKLSPQFCRALAEENPIGLPLTEDDVREWFDFVWARYRDYGYRNHARAIKSWWHRIEWRDIERARERAHNLRVHAERQRIEAQPTNVVDLFSRVAG